MKTSKIFYSPKFLNLRIFSNLKMAHIDLEAVLPNQYNVANLDHPLAQDQAHYANKFHLHDGNSPNFYNVNDDGYGWSNEFGNQARSLESLFRGISNLFWGFFTYPWVILYFNQVMVSLYRFVKK